MSRHEDLRKLREILQRRRRDLLSACEAAREEIRGLHEQERDPEFEEGAQSELADYTLSHLVETQRRALMLIDAAFQRMEQGAFGVCVDCGQDIGFERLQALPYAIRCEEDARRHELDSNGGHRLSMPSL